MTNTERLLRRQVGWRLDRRNLTWPETVRQAERLRATPAASRALRRPAARVSQAGRTAAGGPP